MDFAYSQRVEKLRAELAQFMDEYVYPAEPVCREQLESAADEFSYPPVMDELKREARSLGLWNLFLPDEQFGAGLTNLEYAPLAELTGRSVLAPEALNCSAPDTGNMEILAEFGTSEQQARWLAPLLEGEIRSCFAMTEPEVASSDATNIRGSIRREGDEYVINGRKWWTSGAGSPRCEVAIFMGITDPEAEQHRRQSMVLVPMDTPGLTVERPLTVFGYLHGEHGGHCEVSFNEVRVPVENLLGGEGDGFLIAQSRLGPGRIHHCMRMIGMCERAYELMCERAWQRAPFGKPLARQGVIREWVADSRIEIEQARLMVLKTAWLMDTASASLARTEISAIKVVCAELGCKVVDRAMQVFGGASMSQDTPLAEMYAWARALRFADGPDEVHRMAIGRRELGRFAPSDA